MSLEKSNTLNEFLQALEDVKADLTCGVCGQLCVNPVTLSKCFHTICEEHFNCLESCPTCGTSLKTCTTYPSNRAAVSIESVKEIDKLCSVLRKDTPKKTSLTEKVESVKPHKTSVLKEKSIQNTSGISIGNPYTEKRNKKGETQLHIACRLGKLDKVIDLLKKGANTNTKDNAGWTPLHEVVQNGQIELVQMLLQYNTLIDVPGQGNETPLHEAVRYNHKDIAIVLVQHGADINAQNCKGETPVQLANSEMKASILEAAENVLQTQTINISHIASLYKDIDSEDIRVFCVTDFRTIHNKLKLLAKHHNNLHVEPKFSKNVTHLVVEADDDDICPTTIDILQGIALNLWIVSIKWVTKSSKENLEPFQDYEVVGVGNKNNNGPKNSRFNKYKLLPGIFNGCHFYLHNFVTKYEIFSSLVVTKSNLSKLITDAGGVVLRRAPNPELIPDEEKLVPYHAKKGGKLEICSHYIIFRDKYEPMYNMKHLKALPVGWLIECLEKYELCEQW